MGKQREIPTGVWIFAAAVVMAKIGDAPAGVWILIGILAFIYWLIRSSKAKKGMETAQPQQSQPMATQWQPHDNQSSEVIVNAAKERQKSYPIPAPPKNINMPSRWLSGRESIEVAGMRI